MLTDIKAKNAVATTKPVRLWDRDGLYLEARPQGPKARPGGGKSWMLKYRLPNAEGKLKEKRATLGKYPVMSLKEARDAALAARKLIREGKDPTMQRRMDRLASAVDREGTFEKWTKQWYEDSKTHWTSAYAEQVWRSLEANVLPQLGRLPITAISASHITPIFIALSNRIPDLASKIAQRVVAVFEFAKSHGVILVNPAEASAGRVKKSKEAAAKNLPALTDLSQLGEFLRAAAKANVSQGVMAAHVMTAFTAQRISEVVAASWEELDLEAGLWVIPRSRMKKKDKERGDHTVPLPSQLISLLRQWKEHGHDFVCAAPRDASHVSREAVEKFYRVTLGYRDKHSPHSWRSSFSTLAHDAEYDHAVIEAHLDHVLHKGSVAADYDRGKRLVARQELMRWWGDTLHSAWHGATVLELRKAG